MSDAFMPWAARATAKAARMAAANAGLAVGGNLFMRGLLDVSHLVVRGRLDSLHCDGAFGAIDHRFEFTLNTFSCHGNGQSSRISRSTRPRAQFALIFYQSRK